MNYYPFLKPFLFLFPAESAHHLAITALKKGMVPKARIGDYPSLRSTVCGLSFTHPIGLAAGFDKNAEVIMPLAKQGFSFIEASTVTPRPQQGNPKPRLFRLSKEEAIINRMGFNNYGKEAFVDQLKRQQSSSIVGANIGKNKDTEDPYADYIEMLEAVYGLTDYITVNISSPNTPGLRDLQSAKAFGGLLETVMERCQTLEKVRQVRVPLMVKIAPDLSDKEQQQLAEFALYYKIDALIISNTTISRDGVTGYHAQEQGGLSGKPLFKPSTDILRNMYRYTQGKLPLIGVGGVSSGEDAYSKIRSGASLVQIYSALIYHGFGLVDQICKELSYLLERDGFSTITDAVGIDVN